MRRLTTGPTLSGLTTLGRLAFGGFLSVGLLASSFTVAADAPAAPTLKPAKIDTSAIDVGVEVAFPDVTWKGWEPVSENGRPQQFRPILLTHAGDGSDRLYVPTQQGVIHVIENKDGEQTSTVFMDLSKKVTYKDNENEEGFLGLAFHPRFVKTGEFFIFYTTSDTPHTSVVSKFKVMKDDPTKGDPASEVELIRISKPFWNHNGGTLGFGPDGFLYIAFGDGGSANDPLGSGQNLGSILGKILRINVNEQQPPLKYGIPADNPFVNGKPGARPEVYAYGLRNVWRFSFDRETGDLWAADVGQNLWEEINIVTKGGNYGWNLREGKHPFKEKFPQADPKSPPPSDLTDPIFEYHHDLGKSITGGFVYRGKEVPELVGYYVYADYVAGKLWALKYDPLAKAVVENREIKTDRPMQVISFGEDADGEVYANVVSPDGKGIFRFVSKK